MAHLELVLAVGVQYSTGPDTMRPCRPCGRHLVEVPILEPRPYSDGRIQRVVIKFIADLVMAHEVHEAHQRPIIPQNVTSDIHEGTSTNQAFW